MKTINSFIIFIIISLIMISSCKKDNIEPEPDQSYIQIPSKIELLSGDNQTYKFDNILPENIIVQVKDQYDSICKDAKVYFSVSDGRIWDSVILTDISGNASISWKLGSTIGTQNLFIEAYSADSTVHLFGSPINITAIATASSDETTFGSQNIISGSVENPWSVIACDIDGDGDNDLLESDGNIAWQENIDGYGLFNSYINISTQNENIKSYFPADLDNDGDLDVVFASEIDNKIGWYENLDNYNFNSHIITNTMIDVHAVNTNDIDGDGDNDIAFVSLSGNVGWYENTNSLGNFNTLHLVTDDLYRAVLIISVDIDNDGDYDLVASTSKDSDNKIVWYENLDGNGNFSQEMIIADMVGPTRVLLAQDLTGDGFSDIIYTRGYHEIYWFQNIGGSGTFDEIQVIPLSGSLPRVFSCDINMDGFNDLLATDLYSGKIVWFKNTDGNGNFSEEIVISTSINGGNYVFAADLDGDNDNDVVSVSAYDDKIAWYENQTPIFQKSLTPYNRVDG